MFAENRAIHLSIIVPLYNEQDCVRPLYSAISQSARQVNHPYEILFVDDGSTDATFSVASELARTDGCLRIIKLRRNYGQTPAMAAGIDHARGEILITMDGDLQNDPADLPHLLRKIDEGHDIVVGWRHDRKDRLITRKIPSRIANWLIGKITGIPIKDNGCSLKAYRAALIRHIPLYGDMHRFIPAMTSLAGARLAEIKVRHHARRYGTSKYGLARIYKVLLDVMSIKTLVSFASQPMLWFSLLALPAAAASVLAFVGALYGTLSDPAFLSVPLAGTGVLLGALTTILLLTGVLAELVYKTGDRKVDALWSLTVEELRVETYGSANNHSAAH